MFALNYNRKPTITYRRKPRIETLPSSSDDDSDLDEPEKTRSPLQQYKPNTISIVGELNTKLDQNVFEEKSSSSNDELQTADNRFQPATQEQSLHFIDETIVQESSHAVPPATMDPIAIPSIEAPSNAITPIMPLQATQNEEQPEIVPSEVDPFVALQDEAETITNDQSNATSLAASASQLELDMVCEPPSFDIFDFPELPIPAVAPPLPPPKAAAKPAFDIFDFPTEEDTGTVKLMVASRKHALKRSISQVVPVPRPPQPPPSVLKRSKSEMHEPKRVRFAMESLVSTFHRTSLDLSQPVAIPTAEDDNEPVQAVPPPQPKQKRNLVSRLRGATGQASAPTLRQYNFDEDEDRDEEPVVVDTSQKLDEDEEGHRERMERELAAIMENEFGDDEQENQTRPQYQPKNAMNVRVTYQRKRAPLSSQQDREMLELDNLLERLRAGSSHL